MYGSAAVENYAVPVTVFSQRLEFARRHNHMVRAVVAILMFLASFAAGLWLASTLARADATPIPIVGEWTLNKDVSDLPPSSDQRSDGAGRGEYERGRGYGGGHRGGFGGGGHGGGYGGGQGADRDGGRGEDMARRAEAVREIVTGPERLTITATDSMV